AKAAMDAVKAEGLPPAIGGQRQSAPLSNGARSPTPGLINSWREGKTDVLAFERQIWTVGRVALKHISPAMPNAIQFLPKACSRGGRASGMLVNGLAIGEFSMGGPYTARTQSPELQTKIYIVKPVCKIALIKSANTQIKVLAYDHAST